VSWLRGNSPPTSSARGTVRRLRYPPFQNLPDRISWIWISDVIDVFLTRAAKFLVVESSQTTQRDVESHWMKAGMPDRRFTASAPIDLFW